MAEQDNIQAAPEAQLDPVDIKAFKEGYQLSKQFIYQEPVFDALVEDAKKNPINAISGVVITSMLRIQEEVGQLSLPVAAAMGIALFDDVCDSLEQAGVIENTKELQMQLFQEGIGHWLQANNYPPEQVAQELQAMGAPPEVVQQIMAQGGGQAQQAPAQQMPAAPQQAGMSMADASMGEV